MHTVLFDTRTYVGHKIVITLVFGMYPPKNLQNFMPSEL